MANGMLSSLGNFFLIQFSGWFHGIKKMMRAYRWGGESQSVEAGSSLATSLNSLFQMSLL